MVPTTKKRTRHRERQKTSAEDIEEYLKSLPPPPEEHAYELKMEKRLKRIIEEEERKTKQKENVGSLM